MHIIHNICNIISISCLLFSTVYAHVINYRNVTSHIKRDESLFYYYNQLHDNEKQIYISLKTQIENALRNGGDLYNFSIYDIPVEHESEASIIGFRATSAFVMDNPKYFWIGHGNQQKITTLSNVINEMQINFNQDYTEDQVIDNYKQIKEVGKKLKEKIDTIPTLCEKLQFIHDFLIRLIVYIYDENKSRYNIQGALIEHESVCEGYAEAFTYICQLVNIPTIIVNSKTHEWNFVKMDDGKWYAMDVTYDDPKIENIEFKSGDDRNKKYDYFLIGKNTQIITDNQRMPYNQSKDHQLLNYLLVESSTGFEFPELSDDAYYCPIDKTTNYIKDFYLPNKSIYIYIIIGIAAAFILAILYSCIKGAIRSRSSKSSQRSTQPLYQ